jgi:hypothetical protein
MQDILGIKFPKKNYLSVIASNSCQYKKAEQDIPFGLSVFKA